MLVVTAEEIRRLAPMPALIEALRVAFSKGCIAPVRQVASVPGGAGDRLVLTMPAFEPDGSGVIKLVSVFPENRARHLPTVAALIVVLSETGAPVAVLDGSSITQLRTAAASALASTYLSRSDSSHLVIIGTGALAPYMALAHCTVRPIRTIAVWGRRAARSAATVDAIRTLVGGHVQVLAPSSLKEALATASIVCCATTSPTPVLAGEWLQEGTFVDLVGSFTPSTREADDAVVLRSRIFVDTLAGAMAEAGDLLDPLARGIIDRSRIEGELADLVSSRISGRRTPAEITLFKSVGAAIEDLAASGLVMRALGASGQVPLALAGGNAEPARCER